jgi:hypothetical protein
MNVTDAQKRRVVGMAQEFMDAAGDEVATCALLRRFGDENATATTYMLYMLGFGSAKHAEQDRQDGAHS